jgi:uncharacterized protein
MELPYFRYHPDPISTGRIKPSNNTCIVCGQARGYVYPDAGYYDNEYHDICPWCIANGQAHEKLHVEFTRITDIGKTGADSACGDIPDEKSAEVPPSILEEVAFRTPGIFTWQTNYWLTHCGDAAAFINAVGYDELRNIGKDAIAGIHDCMNYYPDDKWKQLLLVLDREDWPTAYLFQCLHCERYLGYVDWGGFTPPICGWRQLLFLWRVPWLCRLIFNYRRALRRFGKTDPMYAYPRKALEKLKKMQDR